MGKKRVSGQSISIDNIFIINDIVTIRKKIDEALARQGSLTIKTKQEINEIDLAALQLLVYTKEQCEQKSKDLILDIKLSPETMQLVKRSGLDSIFQTKN